MCCVAQGVRVESGEVKLLKVRIDGIDVYPKAV